MTPMLFCQNFYNQWNFFCQILHTVVYNKKFQRNAYQVNKTARETGSKAH